MQSETLSHHHPSHTSYTGESRQKYFRFCLLAFQCSKNASISLSDFHPVIHHIKMIIISSFGICCIFGNLYYVFVGVQHECGRLISSEWKQKHQHQTIYKLYVVPHTSLTSWRERESQFLIFSSSLLHALDILPFSSSRALVIKVEMK